MDVDGRTLKISYFAGRHLKLEKKKEQNRTKQTLK